MALEGVCRASVNRSSHLAAGGGGTTFTRAANFQVKRLGGDKIKRFYTFCVFLQEDQVDANCLAPPSLTAFCPMGNETGFAPRILQDGTLNKLKRMALIPLSGTVQDG